MTNHEDSLGVGPHTVPILTHEPAGAWAVVVLGHGAGAGMRHDFMETLAATLAAQAIATVRFEFPYMAQARRRPDRTPVLLDTVRAVTTRAVEIAAGRPLVAGGKSMGGRMTSLAAADAPLVGVRGLVFFGFPVFGARAAPEEASAATPPRAEHLFSVDLPLLFVAGTRDKLAPLGALRSVVGDLGTRASLHVVDGGDHSLAVPKRAGRAPAAVLGEVAAEVSAWLRRLPATAPQ